MAFHPLQKENPGVVLHYSRKSFRPGPATATGGSQVPAADDAGVHRTELTGYIESRRYARRMGRFSTCESAPYVSALARRCPLASARSRGRFSIPKNPPCSHCRTWIVPTSSYARVCSGPTSKEQSCLGSDESDLATISAWGADSTKRRVPAHVPSVLFARTRRPPFPPERKNVELRQAQTEKPARANRLHRMGTCRVGYIGPRTGDFIRCLKLAATLPRDDHILSTAAGVENRGAVAAHRENLHGWLRLTTTHADAQDGPLNAGRENHARRIRASGGRRDGTGPEIPLQRGAESSAAVVEVACQWTG
jgi:hypothetical protein